MVWGCGLTKGGGLMLVWFEILLAIIVVAVRHYKKNNDKYKKVFKRYFLRFIATILTILLAFTVILKEILQKLLNQISVEEKKLRCMDKK